MPIIKLTLIGAGSRFTFGVVADLIRRSAMSGSVIALVDTDPEALDLSVRIARRMISETGADLQVESTTRRRDVLAGSDFVLNSISVGEPWARERDVEIGEKYGIYQPTSQTVGPAGFMRGLRVIPHAAAIARDIAALCPNARVLNLANPLSAVCRAMARETGLTVIGLCEQWKLTLRPFGEILDVSPDDLDCLSVGINHLTWALVLHREGRDLLPEFLRRLHAPEGKSLRDALPVSCDIYEAFGLWPTGTEDHIAEFFPYFLTPETGGGAEYGLVTRHTTPEQVRARLAERQVLAEGLTSITTLLGPSGESAVGIIASLLGIEAPRIEMVNVPNAGLIDNLPPEAVVELPAHVGPAGVRGLKVGPLPRPIEQILATRVTQHDLLVDAALSGDRRIALQGLLLDAQVVSLKTARSLLSESLEANADWLPSFR